MSGILSSKKITRWPPYTVTPRPSPGLPHTTLLDATTEGGVDSNDAGWLRATFDDWRKRLIDAR